jgi:hypothetical protein
MTKMVVLLMTLLSFSACVYLMSYRSTNCGAGSMTTCCLRNEDSNDIPSFLSNPNISIKDGYVCSIRENCDHPKETRYCTIWISGWNANVFVDFSNEDFHLYKIITFIVTIAGFLTLYF